MIAVTIKHSSSSAPEEAAALRAESGRKPIPYPPVGEKYQPPVVDPKPVSDPAGAKTTVETVVIDLVSYPFLVAYPADRDPELDAGYLVL